jgi:citronellol/citronellal dehydrogenase
MSDATSTADDSFDSTPVSYRSAFAPGLFDGQVILVTGGARASAAAPRTSWPAGAHVVLLGRKADKLAAVRAEIEADGGQADTLVADIRQEDAVAAAVAALRGTGGIDGLVNNAGGQYLAPLESISAKGWEAVLHTNLTGGFLVARECYRQHLAAHGGAIVNIVADMGRHARHTARRAPAWSASPRRRRSNGPPGRARERGGAGLHRLQRHGPPARGRRHAARHAPPCRGALRQRGRGLGGHRVPAQPAASFISGSVLRVDGARPQVRMGWPMRRQTPRCSSAAVRPFDGFHRARRPGVSAAMSVSAARRQETMSHFESS